MKKNDCKEKIVKKRKGDAKYFDTNDERFMENPFEICVKGFD